MIKTFRGRQNGKTWAETVSDAAMPALTVEQIKANNASKTDEQIAFRARLAGEHKSQTELSRNVNQAYREMLADRGMRTMTAIVNMSDEKFDDYVEYLRQPV